MAKEITFDIIARDRASAILDSAGGKVEGFGAKLGRLAGLSSTLGVAGGEVGNIIGQVGGIAEAASASHGKLSKAMVGVGGSAAVAGVALMNLGSGPVEAQNQLDAAVQATGKGYDDFGNQVDSLVGKQTKYGNTDAEVKNSLQKLTTAYGDPKKALEQMGLVTDLAAAKHISLSDAATMVAKAHGGAGRIFKEFGLNVKDVTDLQKNKADADKNLITTSTNLEKAQKTLSDLEAVDSGKKKLTIADQNKLRDAKLAVVTATDKHAAAEKNATTADAAAKDGVTKYDEALKQLATKTSGQAEAAQDSFAGKMRSIKATVENAATAFGEKYGPAITAAGTAVTATGVLVEALKGKQVLQTAATGIATAAQWLWNAAMGDNPIGLVIIAIGALVAGIIWVATKTTWFQTIWEYASHAIAEVWRWLWNTIIAPIIRFILNGFANLADAIGTFLGALGKLPNFGWATDAANKMHGAADAARALAGNINDIPKDVTIFIKTAIQSLPPGMVPGHASGGRNISAGWSLVGEQGPELMYIPNGADIYSNAESKAMATPAAQQGGPSTFHIYDADGALLGSLKALIRGENSAQARAVAAGVW